MNSKGSSFSMSSGWRWSQRNSILVNSTTSTCFSSLWKITQHGFIYKFISHSSSLTSRFRAEKWHKTFRCEVDYIIKPNTFRCFWSCWITVNSVADWRASNSWAMRDSASTDGCEKQEKNQKNNKLHLHWKDSQQKLLCWQIATWKQSLLLL